MAAPDFYGPNLKVERADQHINDLEAIFDAYVLENIKRLSPNRDHGPLKESSTIDASPFPKHTPTVLGDAIHNLKSALDHAYCILAHESPHFKNGLISALFGPST